MTGKNPKRTPRPGLDEYGRTPLHDAALAGDTGTMATQLAAGADKDAQDDNGMTPLHFAVQGGKGDAVRILLDAGANPNLCDRHGNGPLWVAVLGARGDLSIVEALIRSGAEGDKKNSYGRSARDMALTIGHGLERLFTA